MDALGQQCIANGVDSVLQGRQLALNRLIFLVIGIESAGA